MEGKASPETDMYAMGAVAAAIHDILPARVIVERMVNEAAEILSANATLVSKPKL